MASRSHEPVRATLDSLVQVFCVLCCKKLLPPSTFNIMSSSQCCTKTILTAARGKEMKSLLTHSWCSYHVIFFRWNYLYVMNNLIHITLKDFYNSPLFFFLYSKPKSIKGIFQDVYTISNGSKEEPTKKWQL